MSILAEVTTATDLSSFLETVKTSLGDFNVANLGTVIAAGVGVAAVLVLCWFGYRFVSRKLMGALKKGKL